MLRNDACLGSQKSWRARERAYLTWSWRELLPILLRRRPLLRRRLRGLRLLVRRPRGRLIWILIHSKVVYGVCRCVVVGVQPAAVETGKSRIVASLGRRARRLACE